MGFFMPELDQVPVLRPPVGFGRPGQIKGLQDIGLSLGVIPVEDIGRRIKIKLLQIVIPVVFKL